MEFVGELDLNPRPSGAEATETDPRSDPGLDSEVISLMFEAVAVVEFGMLFTGSSIDSSTSSSLARQVGLAKVPIV